LRWPALWSDFLFVLIHKRVNPKITLGLITFSMDGSEKHSKIDSMGGSVFEAAHRPRSSVRNFPFPVAEFHLLFRSQSQRFKSIPESSESMKIGKAKCRGRSSRQKTQKWSGR
jgi:hypothetical protein